MRQTVATFLLFRRPFVEEMAASRGVASSTRPARPPCWARGRGDRPPARRHARGLRAGDDAGARRGAARRRRCPADDSSSWRPRQAPSPSAPGDPADGRRRSSSTPAPSRAWPARRSPTRRAAVPHDPRAIPSTPATASSSTWRRADAACRPLPPLPAGGRAARRRRGGPPPLLRRLRARQRRGRRGPDPAPAADCLGGAPHRPRPVEIPPSTGSTRSGACRARPPGARRDLARGRAAVARGRGARPDRADDGPLARRHVLVVGAAAWPASWPSPPTAGARIVVVTNRTAERARALAFDVGGSRPASASDGALPDAGAIVALAGPWRPRPVGPAALAGLGRPVVDLSSPPVDPGGPPGGARAALHVRGRHRPRPVEPQDRLRRRLRAARRRDGPRLRHGSGPATPYPTSGPWRDGADERRRAEELDRLFRRMPASPITSGSSSSR